jgi:hypothetical protein
MLDAYIISEIQKREQEKRQEERPFLELPLPYNNIPVIEEDITEAKRVIIIDTVDQDPDDDVLTIEL